MTEHRRHSPQELGIVKFAARQQGAGLRFVSFGRQLRQLALPLIRDGLLEVWFQQVPGEQPALRGPHFSLSYAGARLAAALTGISVYPNSMIFPAPRGLSGAEQLS